jgi:hypothetical protein
MSAPSYSMRQMLFVRAAIRSLPRQIQGGTGGRSLRKAACSTREAVPPPERICAGILDGEHLGRPDEPAAASLGDLEAS